MLSPSSVKLSWTPDPSRFSRYTITQILGPQEITLTGVSADQSSFVVRSGIAPGVNYTFKLIGLPLPGVGDDKRVAVASVEIPRISLAWQLVNAVGPSPGSTTIAIADEEIMDPTEMFVRLQWKNLLSTPVQSYRLYRSENFDSTDWTSMTPIYSGSDHSYVDKDNLAVGKKLYYSVLAIRSDGSVDSISDITYVRIPPQHQTLVHRESANFEMCMLLNSEIDPDNFNRCAYSGLGSVNDYYDFGKLLFVDRYELGVNLSTRDGSCGATSCRNVPNTAANVGAAGSNKTTNVGFASAQEGEVFGFSTYTINNSWRSTVASPRMKMRRAENLAENVIIDPRCGGGFGRLGACSTANVEVELLANFNTANVSYYLSKFVEKGYTNAPKSLAADISAPQFGRQSWYNPCQARKTVGFGNSRIPFRNEQITYSAWNLPDEPQRKTAGGSPIAPLDLEHGDNHLSLKACNTSNISEIFAANLGNANFMDHVFPNGDLFVNLSNRPVSDLRDSPTAGDGSFRNWGMVTGSSYTGNCVSRFGVQDHFGNALDAVDLTFNVNTTASTAQIFFPRGSGDNSVTGYRMDGLDGPGGSTRDLTGSNIFTPLSAVTNAVPTTCPSLRSSSSVFTHFLPTLGFPFMNADKGALPLSSLHPQTYLGEDSFCVDSAPAHPSISWTSTALWSFSGGSFGSARSSVSTPSSIPNARGIDGAWDAYDAGHVAGRWSLIFMRASGGNHLDSATGMRCVTEDN